MKLSVVIPFCAADCALAIKLLDWMLELGRLPENDCLLIAANSIKPDVLTEVQVKATEVFRKTTVVRPPFALPNEAHPMGPNWMFEVACKRIWRMPPAERPAWLWCEPDSVPLRTGWLGEIELEYDQALKNERKVLSHITRLKDPRYPKAIPSGVAVYPGDAFEHYKRLQLNRKVAWDVQFANDMIKHVYPSQTIRCHLNHEKSPTFIPARNGTLPPNTMVLGELPKTTALFHPNKDGSLIKLIRKPSIRQAIAEFREEKAKHPEPLPPPPPAPKIRPPVHLRFIHCVERHTEIDAESEARVLTAFHSWVTLYETGKMIPCHVWEYPRDARKLGDTRELPFLKDILVEGMTLANDNDIVLLTNDDTILHELALHAIQEKLRTMPACSSFRLNFAHGQMPQINQTMPATQVTVNQDYGRDVFAFRKRWLVQYWHQIPDFVLGELEWDLVMAAMVRRSAGDKLDPASFKDISLAELPAGYVFHQMHDRRWMTSEYGKAPAKLYNNKLATAWFSSHGLQALASSV